MPPPYKLEDDVVREVEKCFRMEDQKTVLYKLEWTQMWAEQSGPPARIHLAIVWKSKGDLKAFDASIRYDLDDWRDLLIEMGLANEDWRDKLARKNIFPEKWHS